MFRWDVKTTSGRSQDAPTVTIGEMWLAMSLCRRECVSFLGSVDVMTFGSHRPFHHHKSPDHHNHTQHSPINTIVASHLKMTLPSLCLRNYSKILLQRRANQLQLPILLGSTRDVITTHSGRTITHLSGPQTAKITTPALSTARTATSAIPTIPTSRYVPPMSPTSTTPLTPPQTRFHHHNRHHALPRRAHHAHLGRHRPRLGAQATLHLAPHLPHPHHRPADGRVHHRRRHRRHPRGLRARPPRQERRHARGTRRALGRDGAHQRAPQQRPGRRVPRYRQEVW